ncbi:hypothetical protein BD309DRAFT_393665 [Dichomitus squalens]|nr:hypothetical protein BD309DRAFT_393665 [Dichomitus squalens]
MPPIVYTSSLLASMNTRKVLRDRSVSQSGSGHSSHVDPVNFHTAVQITVDKTVDFGSEHVIRGAVSQASERKDAVSPV